LSATQHPEAQYRQAPAHWHSLRDLYGWRWRCVARLRCRRNAGRDRRLRPILRRGERAIRRYFLAGNT